jgi:hypothetical protein
MNTSGLVRLKKSKQFGPLLSTTFLSLYALDEVLKRIKLKLILFLGKERPRNES